MRNNKLIKTALNCFCSKEVKEHAENLLKYQKQIKYNNEYLHYLRGHMSIEDQCVNRKSVILNDEIYKLHNDTSNLSRLCLDEQKAILGNCSWIRQLQHKLVQNYIDKSMPSI